MAEPITPQRLEEIRARAGQDTLELLAEIEILIVHCDDYARLVQLQDKHIERLDGDLARERQRIKEFQELAAAIWLYVDWRYVTRQLTTPQKELFADSVNACADPDDDGWEGPERWWREDATVRALTGDGPDEGG